MDTRGVILLLALVLLAVAMAYPIIQTSESGSNTSDRSAPQVSQPITREASYVLSNLTISEYPYVRARDPVVSTGPSPLLAGFIDLDVTTNTGEVEFEFSITGDEVFLAIDGASLSMIEVTITIHYPDSSSEEYVTRVDEPLHKVIEQPTPGTYRVKLSIGTARTRAWIQVTTMNNGVATLEGMEKQYRYFAPGEARYLKVSTMYSSWVLTYLRVIQGGYIVVELWRLPEMIKVEEDLVYYEYLELFSPKSSYYLEEGEYILCIRSIGHTDTSYAVAEKNAVISTLSPDQGIAVGYLLPYDLELFWINIPENIEWIALDWSVESISSDPAYSKVILFSPDDIILYSGDGYIHQLNYWHCRRPVEGKYLLLTLGTSSSLTLLKASSPLGVIDLSNYPALSLKIAFTQTGQAVYFKVVSNYTFAVAVNTGVSQSRLGVINSDGWLLDDYYAWSFATSIGLHSLLSTSGEVYIIRVQASKGDLLLHLRPHDYIDHLVETPDHSDLQFRFPGDLVVLGVSMRNGRYIAQYYASLNETANTYFWFIDSEGRIKLSESISWYQGGFYVLRYPYETYSRLSSIWRVILVSNQPGLNARLSQLQEGDEYYVSTPYHEYHTFSFDYEIKGIKVVVPDSKWALIATFNDKPAGMAKIVALNQELQYITTHDLQAHSVLNTFLRDVANGTWTVVIVGTKQANISTSIITHLDILRVVEGIETITVPYTTTVFTTTTRTTTRTSTTTETRTQTTIRENTVYSTLVEFYPTTHTVYEYLTITQPIPIILEYTVTSTETIMEHVQVPITHRTTITIEKEIPVSEAPKPLELDTSTLMLGAVIILQLVTIILLTRRYK